MIVMMTMVCLARQRRRRSGGDGGDGAGGDESRQEPLGQDGGVVASNPLPTGREMQPPPSCLKRCTRPAPTDPVQPANQPTNHTHTPRGVACESVWHEPNTLQVPSSDEDGPSIPGEWAPGEWKRH